jgi:hypothetical protein
MAAGTPHSAQQFVATLGLRQYYVSVAASVILKLTQMFSPRIVEFTLEQFAGVTEPRETLRALGVLTLEDIAKTIQVPSQRTYDHIEQTCAKRRPCHSRDNLCRFDAFRNMCLPSALSYHRYKPSSPSPNE